jgi:trans-aconitate methyltransferase
MTIPEPQSNPWNADLYDGRHSFVWKRGGEVAELLAPKPGERILDLGCGTGHLTAQIAERGAKVVGIDNAASMIAQARTTYPNLRFELLDAAEMPFHDEFDAVFSNAVLHWIKRQADVAAGIARALKPGGRFVAEFGGRGNIRHIYDALCAALAAAGIAEPQRLSPWYYPSIGEYAALLEQLGLETSYAVLFDRPTPLEGERGLRNWLDMFASPWLSAVPAGQRGAVVDHVERLLRPSLYRDGTWTADYRRLRIVAIKL